MYKTTSLKKKKEKKVKERRIYPQGNWGLVGLLALEAVFLLAESVDLGQQPMRIRAGWSRKGLTIGTRALRVFGIENLRKSSPTSSPPQVTPTSTANNSALQSLLGLELDKTTRVQNEAHTIPKQRLRAGDLLLAFGGAPR